MFNQLDCNHGGQLPVKVENGRIVSICDCLINNMRAEHERQLLIEGSKNV